MRKSLSECETWVRAEAKEDDDGQLGTVVGQRARQRGIKELFAGPPGRSCFMRVIPTNM
jgi:hypothetical protein